MSRGYQAGIDFVALMGKTREIATLLASPGILASESVEVARAIRMVDGDFDRARQALTYARDVLVTYGPDDPLVASANDVLDTVGDGRA